MEDKEWVKGAIDIFGYELLVVQRLADLMSFLDENEQNFLFVNVPKMHKKLENIQKTFLRKMGECLWEVMQKEKMVISKEIGYEEGDNLPE